MPSQQTLARMTFSRKKSVPSKSKERKSCIQCVLFYHSAMCRIVSWLAAMMGPCQIILGLLIKIGRPESNNKPLKYYNNG